MGFGDQYLGCAASEGFVSTTYGHAQACVCTHFNRQSMYNHFSGYFQQAVQINNCGALAVKAPKTL